MCRKSRSLIRGEELYSVHINQGKFSVSTTEKTQKCLLTIVSTVRIHGSFQRPSPTHESPTRTFLSSNFFSFLVSPFVPPLFRGLWSHRCHPYLLIPCFDFHSKLFFTVRNHCLTHVSSVSAFCSTNTKVPTIESFCLYHYGDCVPLRLYP